VVKNRSRRPEARVRFSTVYLSAIVSQAERSTLRLKAFVLSFFRERHLEVKGAPFAWRAFHAYPT
jgi:hypothetical protein